MGPKSPVEQIYLWCAGVAFDVEYGETLSWHLDHLAGFGTNVRTVSTMTTRAFQDRVEVARRPALPRRILLQVFRVVIRAGADRTALLSGLPSEFVAALPVGNSVSAQILIDLSCANSAQFPNQSVPVEAWLENAAALLDGREDTTVIYDALQHLRHDAK